MSMKRNFVLGFLVVLIAVASCSFTSKSFETDDKDKLLLDLITYVLERGHYEPKDIDDEFSANVFDDFIEKISVLILIGFLGQDKLEHGSIMMALKSRL